MMLLFPTDTPLYRTTAKEHPTLLGYLVGPRKRGIPHFLRSGNILWAADNDAYNQSFNPKTFLDWLRTIAPYKDRCLFVACPDVVGDAAATLARFHAWRPRLENLDLPIAYVLQNGATPDTVPWTAIDAVFVGGTTDWKMGPDPLQLLVHAGRLGLWRHVGRVNSVKRMHHFWPFADSFDGTTFAIRPDNALRAFLPEMLSRSHQGKFQWS